MNQEQVGDKKVTQQCLDNHKEEVEQKIIGSNDLDPRKIQYTIKYIDQTDDAYYYTAQISNNEQYIAYGGCDQVLKVYDLKHDKLIMKIQFNLSIFHCQFTSDSRYLYVGCCYSPVKEFSVIYCYSVQKAFKKLLQFNKRSIQYLCSTTIQSKCLIIGGYKAITQIDFRCKKQIFKLITHQYVIQTLEYDERKNMVISASYDRSIKSQDIGMRKLIINKITELIIWHIQLIDQNKYLLSLDEQSNLYKWRIDEKDLTKLQKIINPDKIFYFRQIHSNDEQYMLLICKKYVKILNSKEEVVNMFNHLAENSIELVFRRYLDNLKYIYIPSCSIQNNIILEQIILAVADI